MRAVPFTVKEVRVKNSVGIPQHASSFVQVSSNNYIWNDGAVQAFEGDISRSHNFVPVEASTILCCGPERRFCGVDFDASLEDVANHDLTNGEWPTLSGFNYLSGRRAIEVAMGEAERKCLPRGCTPRWLELFPQPYHPDTARSGRADVEVAGLVGALSTVLALAAMSIPNQYQRVLLPRCMQIVDGRRTWMRHNLHAFKPFRTIVVTIYSNQQENAARWLRDLHDGRSGPIITC